MHGNRREVVRHVVFGGKASFTPRAAPLLTREVMPLTDVFLPL